MLYFDEHAGLLSLANAAKAAAVSEAAEEAAAKKNAAPPVVKVEPWNGTYDCLIYGDPVRKASTVYACRQCVGQSPFHAACAGQQWSQACPQCKGSGLTVVPWKPDSRVRGEVVVLDKEPANDTDEPPPKRFQAKEHAVWPTNVPMCIVMDSDEESKSQGDIVCELKPVNSDIGSEAIAKFPNAVLCGAVTIEPYEGTHSCIVCFESVRRRRDVFKCSMCTDVKLHVMCTGGGTACPNCAQNTLVAWTGSDRVVDDLAALNPSTDSCENLPVSNRRRLLVSEKPPLSDDAVLNCMNTHCDKVDNKAQHLSIGRQLIANICRLATGELPGIKESSEEMMPENRIQISDSGRKKCSSCHAKKSLTEFSGKATCDGCLAKKRRTPVVTDSSIQLEVGNGCLQKNSSNTRHFKLQEQAETAPLNCCPPIMIATVPVHTGSDAQVAAYGTSSAPNVQAAAYGTVGDPREGWQLCSQAQLKGQPALLNAPLGPLIDQVPFQHLTLPPDRRKISKHAHVHTVACNNGMSCQQKCSSCHATKPLIEFSGKATCGRCRIKKRKRRQQHKSELEMQGRSTNPNGQSQDPNGTVQVTQNSTQTSKVQS